MHRKQFLKLMALATGGTLMPVDRLLSAQMRAADLEHLARQATGEGEWFWRMVRTQFQLDPDWVFLNFGGLGACPLPVVNHLADALRAEELQPAAGYDEKLWNAAKDKLAGLLGGSCRREDLALISGATEGVGMIVNGLPLGKGDEVITSTHEHICVNATLLNHRRHNGIVIRRFEPDIENASGNVERIERLINRRTRLILISHVTCTTGQCFPVQEIARLARDRGVTFALDGAQGPLNTPMDIDECGADFYVASTHKWVMGPKRTGFLHVRPGMLDALKPMVAGSGGVDEYDMDSGEIRFAPSAQRFEHGTQNEALFYAMGTAAEFIESIGVDRILRHCRQMSEAFLAGLQELPGVELLSPREEAFRTLMISFRIPGRDCREIADDFARKRIRVRSVKENDLNAIRVSFYLCNHMGHVEKVLDHVKKLAV